MNAYWAIYIVEERMELIEKEYYYIYPILSRQIDYKNSWIDKIELLPPTKSRHEGGKIYRITQSGKCTVDKYLSADYNEVTIVPIMI